MIEIVILTAMSKDKVGTVHILRTVDASLE